jgi:spore germination protein YaaH
MARAPSHHRCGWIGADSAAVGTTAFATHADHYDAVHPVWFTANADGSVHANAYADDATVVATAHARHIELMPLVYGGDDASIVRGIIASAALTNAHVQALMSLVLNRDYDGLEIDYEHLWSASDRPGFVAFIGQLTAALHARGKTISLAVSPIDVDNGQNAYDYGALMGGGVDVMHLMGYDFHYLGGDHAGPLAPLGWLDAVAARVQALGIADRTLLGIANYGIGSGWYAAAGDVVKRCLAGSYLTTTSHMASCPYGSYAAGLAPHCTTSQGDAWFEDALSAAEKARTVAAHGLRGVTYYTIGAEPPGYLDALRAVFP